MTNTASLFCLVLGSAHALTQIPLRGTSLDAKLKSQQGALSSKCGASTSQRRRAFLLGNVLFSGTSSLLISPPYGFSLDTLSSTESSAWPTSDQASITLQEPSPLGVELKEIDLGPNQSLLVVQNVAPESIASNTVRRGMILRDYSRFVDLQRVLKDGPYPVTVVFVDDRRAPVFRIIVTKPGNDPSSNIKSRRDDVLEIRYKAQYEVSKANGGGSQWIEYDSSDIRGTGQPYFMVLGSGDMLPGVDQGLVGMTPGEARRIVIPPPLAYGAKGNKFFRIPPDQTLVWDVELLSVNGER